MQYMQNHYSRVITLKRETVAMTSTTESKRVFKSQRKDACYDMSLSMLFASE